MTSHSIALVTGATGFIGKRMTERLIDAGWSVRVLVRNPDKLDASLRSRIEIVVGDLQDVETLNQAVNNVSVIFHCAANVHTWDTWDAYYAANVRGVENLMTAIANHNPQLSRLVHLSTVDVYGFPLVACDENVDTSGAGFAYGTTKLLGETVVKEQGDRLGISYTIIRPANVIGPGSQFIERIGAELKSGIMLTVSGGHTHAGLVYIDNLVDYLLWAAGAENADKQCYNVRDAHDATWASFIKVFRAGIKGKGIVINLPFALADGVARVLEGIHRLVLPRTEPLLHRLLVRFFGRTCGHSAEKIRSASQYHDKVDFDTAMARSIAWFLTQHNTH